jgi:hypothetical protein
MSMIERRNDRTNNPWLATSHYLTAVAERTGLDALVLASREGLSLSSADPHAQRLAAVAPMIADEPTALSARAITAATGGDKVQIWRVTVRGRPSYLIATGTWADLTEEIQWAIDRIFGAPRHGLPN